MGGACAGNQGDPIVQYDRLADRWFLSQIGSESVPYTLCQAVSKTNDPTGAYSLYEYSFGNNFPTILITRSGPPPAIQPTCRWLTCS